MTLEFWAIGAEGEILRKMLDDFHQLHPDIRVVVQQIPWNAAHEKLLTAFAGRTTPDLCQLGNTWIPEFAMLQAIRELSEPVTQSQIVAHDDYFDGIWQTNRVDQALYGVPWYVDTRVLFYRQDLLRAAGWGQPPQTWQQWRQAMLDLRAIMNPQSYPILLPTDEWEQIVILGMQMPEPLLRDREQYGNFRSASFRRAMEFYQALYQDRLAPVLAGTEVSNVWQELARGRYAMYITGPWNIGEFRRRLPADQLANWSTAPLPAPDEPGVGYSMAGGCSIAIFQNSQFPSQAWTLIEYLSRPETQLRFYQLSGNLPARKSAWNAAPLRDDPWISAFGQQLNHVRPTPRVPEWERIATKVYEVADRLIRQRGDLEQAVEALDRAVDRILEKRRWMLQRQDSVALGATR